MLVQKESGFVLPTRNHNLLILGLPAENYLAFIKAIFPPVHQGLGLYREHDQYTGNQDA